MYKSLLSPVDRVSETLYGVIMTLTYTCTLKIAIAERTEVKQMLYAAIGCNIAWGLVDGIMYVLTADAEKWHNLKILQSIQESKNPDNAKKIISDEMSPLVGPFMKTDDLENIRQELLRVPMQPQKLSLHPENLFTTVAIFIYVFLSTFPVVIPFLFIKEPAKALRVSNAVAIIIMFICGWLLGRYSGRKPWFTGFMMSLIGIILVTIAISLGG